MAASCRWNEAYFEFDNTKLNDEAKNAGAWLQSKMDKSAVVYHVKNATNLKTSS